jgi:2-hydroxy-6-oxonona-2,4-dienedioate hydrolase
MDTDEAVDFIKRLDAQATKVETALQPAGRMVWRRWGDGPGRPVVLLHGGAGSWVHWIRNITPLARGRTVWVPDMPGFGDSDLPAEGLDADTLGPLVQQGALEVLQGRRFDLVGFSFGSLVAAAIAADAPPTLDRTVLVSASALGLFQGPAEMKSMKGVTDPAERIEVQRFNLNAMMLHDRAAIDALAITAHKQAAVRERVKNRQLARTDYLLQLASRWGCPVSGIWAREDFAYRTQFDKLQQVAAQLHLQQIVYIEGAGHWVQYERAAEFDRILARLLEA